MHNDAKAGLLAYLQERARELVTESSAATLPLADQLRAEAEELMTLHRLITRRDQPAVQQLSLRFPKAA